MRPPLACSKNPYSSLKKCIQCILSWMGFFQYLSLQFYGHKFFYNDKIMCSTHVYACKYMMYHKIWHKTKLVTIFEKCINVDFGRAGAIQKPRGDKVLSALSTNTCICPPILSFAPYANIEFKFWEGIPYFWETNVMSLFW